MPDKSLYSVVSFLETIAQLETEVKKGNAAIHENCGLRKQIQALQAENTRLVNARRDVEAKLSRYGRHDHDCERRWVSYKIPATKGEVTSWVGVCTCGFERDVLNQKGDGK